MRRFMLSIVLLSALCLPLSRPALAGEIKRYAVVVTNISHDQIIGRPVAISHNEDFHLYSPGSPIIPPLAALAEDGDAALLLAYAATLPSVYEAAASSRSLRPGASALIEVNADSGFPLITVAGMLATTKDAFFVIQGAGVPKAGEKVIEAGIFYAEKTAGPVPRPLLPDFRDSGGDTGLQRIAFTADAPLLVLSTPDRAPVVRITIRPAR